MGYLSSFHVTVYITNYNYGRFIQQAIESVLVQTFQDFEIIIIDDGSTDNSKEIIEKFADNSKIKIIFQKNKGLNVTNNIALRVAQGRYIMRLDADDYLDPNALLVMSNMLEKDPELGLVFPDYFIVDAEDNILHMEKRHDFGKEVSLLDQPAHGACTMIRKKFLQQLGGYDEKYSCQDGYELWVKFTARYKVANVNTPLFYYRQHGRNLTSNEQKILDTRADIKAKFVKEKHPDKKSVLAIIPVRGSKHNPRKTHFIKLGNKTILDSKIQDALQSERITHIVVTSPDPEIGEYINKNYGNNLRIRFHKRSENLARLNTGLSETIVQVMNDIEEKYSIVLVLTLEYPFAGSKIMDDAINTLLLFNADSVISVRQETNTFFQHDGSGMKPILNQDKFSKLEREALYKHTGGVIAINSKHIRKGRKLISGRVGHIVVDQKTAFEIKTKFDIEVAQIIAANPA